MGEETPASFLKLSVWVCVAVGGIWAGGVGGAAEALAGFWKESVGFGETGNGAEALAGFWKVMVELGGGVPGRQVAYGQPAGICAFLLGWSGKNVAGWLAYCCAGAMLAASNRPRPARVRARLPVVRAGVLGTGAIVGRFLRNGDV